ncbi:branched-chain amino acid ABC transporter permease [Salinadaptatus halalkaliphilus]|uniref:Branched-chain amino acid ABC transporter permease n=1 Tax=Salinadaptatus halalkaliphilus TaxID=2419781 RepID=A0A4S3TP38_9EURY|nr:AzlC family ABC transporter permease [Salinadaptatus halalkaliphilus]THE66084.1 branched-chain amino acid ABC transporter permease [Salinadaptatus halalkaliphilus]
MAIDTDASDGPESVLSDVSERGDEGPQASESGSDAPSAESVTFEWDGVRAGFLTCLPVALGVGGYGIAFGVLANQVGLSVAEAALMSATVLAGASQIVAVELWADPLPVAAILVTVFAINLRYSLMGAALQPWFRHLRSSRVYGSLFFMADENWALTMRELTSGSGRGAFLLGSGIAMWLFWVGSTIVGALAGETVGDPTQYGFDFILAAVFVALAAELWEGRSSLVPWLVALAVSVVAATLVPGRWYILLGGLAAASVEVIRYDG